jgi:hypothetical protein
MDPFFLHAVLTALLGAAGAVYLLRSSDLNDCGVAIALLLPLVLVRAPYYLTHAEFRYRLAVDPLLTVLCARVLQEVFATGMHFVGYGKYLTDL